MLLSMYWLLQWWEVGQVQDASSRQPLSSVLGSPDSTTSGAEQDTDSRRQPGLRALQLLTIGLALKFLHTAFGVRGQFACA